MEGAVSNRGCSDGTLSGLRVPQEDIRWACSLLVFPITLLLPSAS